MYHLYPLQTQVDELTSGVLIREDDSLPEDITLSTEGKAKCVITFTVDNFGCFLRMKN